MYILLPRMKYAGYKVYCIVSVCLEKVTLFITTVTQVKLPISFFIYML